MKSTAIWKARLSSEEPEQQVLYFYALGYGGVRIIPENNSFVVNLCGREQGTYPTLIGAKRRANWILNKLMTV